jgi:Gpi18-like mannosyltransferase
MLMRYVALALGGGRRNVYLAGMLVSWTCFVLAAVLLYRLARHFVAQVEAQRAVIYTTVFPFAFFFGVVYSESLYLMLIVGSFLA